MTPNKQPSMQQTFHCPGQAYAISRAVHLGRLAAFYPACRECPHRFDTGTLSPEQVEQLQEVQTVRKTQPLFHEEGAGGVCLNDLTPNNARNMAAAFGMETVLSCSDEPSSPRKTTLLLAGDGRANTADLSAAVAEGLRWSGCDVLDLGPATSASLAFSIRSQQAQGGLLVGNPSHEPQIVGLHFFDAEARPLSLGGTLEPIVARYQQGLERPCRTFGVLRREATDAKYLEALGDFYHALRPLRVFVDSASKPFLDFLQQLTAKVACQAIADHISAERLPDRMQAESAHFAMRIDGNGETCQVFDERGRIVSAEQLLLLFAENSNQASPPLVLESGVSLPVIRLLENRGYDVILSSPQRAAMAAAMQKHHVKLGGGPSGRFWFALDQTALPDALMALTRLLIVLSRSDEPFSVVLDREASMG